ncbi:MAG: hypothetical protein ABR928_11495 [Terracidiphilus sp.]|jgi:hypothetical protein
MKDPLGGIDFLGPESKTLYRIQNAMRYAHGMLPRCKFCALGIVCAASLLLTAQTPTAPRSTPRLSSAGSELRAAASPLKLDGGAVSLDGPWQFQLSDNPAWASAEFAHAAQQFGQEDDIIVLMLSFAPVGVMHA